MSPEVPGILGPVTLGEAMRTAQRTLAAAGVEDAGRDARLLVAAAAGCTTADIIAYPERVLSANVRTRIADMVARRSKREPVSRILGSREFYGRQFMLSPATLDPRADSETLIDTSLEIAAREGWRERPIRIIDIGTGTGCLLLTLLAELPLASGVGTDISEEALATAAANARALGLGARAVFEKRDLLHGVSGPFDLVISNPPYIARADIDGLAPEVREYDPWAALDGGPDGLNMYREIASQLPSVSPTCAVLEVGAGQDEAVAVLLHQAFVKTRRAEVTKHYDLGGHARCVALRLQS